MCADPPCSFWSSAAPAWLAGIGTLVVAIVAVFQEWIRRLVVRPRLRLHARVDRPDAEKTRWENGADVYYFRLAITNVGNTAAQDVQVYLAAVERETPGGGYVAVERFSPMNLLWAHIRKPTRDALLPGMPPVYCDMAHIADPKMKAITREHLDGIVEGIPPNETVLGLDLEVTPFSRSHLLERGTYRFRLILAASNHARRDYTLRVVINGQWFDDQDRMFREGFGMQLSQNFWTYFLRNR